MRNILDFQRGRLVQLPLGGNLFDVVITASGPAALEAVRSMDLVQRGTDVEGPVDACGPVIEDPERGCLIWLVPPGTSQRWEPHRFGVCLGRPHQIVLPAMKHSEPPGAYWLRPCRGDRLVPPIPLRELLSNHQPGPIPHEALPEVAVLGAAF
ncbi:hypothetical protein [Streptomyces prasinosporus]|uniref:hypothetical protein n=1 Tax=Streptomyces prasinosporus TaxID=68256 RepID=UPI0031E9540E